MPKVFVTLSYICESMNFEREEKVKSMNIIKRVKCETVWKRIKLSWEYWKRGESERVWKLKKRGEREGDWKLKKMTNVNYEYWMRW